MVWAALDVRRQAQSYEEAKEYDQALEPIALTNLAYALKRRKAT